MMREMRSGKMLMLATKEFAKENRNISWLHLISTLLLLAIALIGTLLDINLIFRLLFSILTALLIMRMFIIYHDFLHRTILQRSAAAKIIMNIYGVLVLNPPSIWKRTHDYHHKHNSKLFSAGIGSYPVMTKAKFSDASKAEKFSYLAVRHPLTILFGYLFMFIYGMCIQSFIANPKLHKDALLALVIHIVLISLTLWLGGWQVLMLTILIPFFVSSALGAYLFFAQHNFPGVRFKTNEKWDYLGAALHSSSYMVMNPVMRWFTGNIGYHHIHHVNAHIPFYRLRETMRNIPEFQLAIQTSLKPSDIYKCLMLKVWDAEEQKMVRL
jgi:acyl-lipid omega-6 desaturase (Delta-12 desaturase)